MFRITETSGWFCQHQFSGAKEEAWKVKEEGDQLEQMLIKNRSGCFMAFLFGLPSSVFFSKGTNDWGQKLSGNACYFYESDYIDCFGFLRQSCVFHKINSKKLSQEAGTRRRGKGGHFQLRWEQARSASLVSDSAKRQEGRLRSQQQKALQALLKRIQRDRGEQNLGLDSWTVDKFGA